MNPSSKKPLVSVTKDDFELQTFRAGGKGGQNANKVNAGVRLIHKASGARGEARDSRHYHQNRKNAFLRLTETPVFKAWLKVETARALGQEIEIDEQVKRAMAPKNIRVEVQENGKWVESD